MKSILVVLDSTPAAAAARALAFALAQKHKARVFGICVLDVGYLTAPEPEGIGGAYYKFRSDVARLKRANDHITTLVEDFERERGKRKLTGQGIAVDGDPVPEILRAADMHDLVIIGRDTTFHSDPADRTSATVERLLKQNSRPILVTPPSGKRISPILVAYDGSIPAARSLQMFTLLQMADDADIHVISVQSTDDEAQALVQRAAGYLELYDVTVHVHRIASSADPADVLLAETESLQAGIVVMGAFGHRGWREALLGSCTRRLLDECPTTLFIHH